MKKFITLLLCCAALFTSCVSTSNTFSSAEKQTFDNMIVSVDEFQGHKIIEHKKGYLWDGALTTVYLCPKFVVAENGISFNFDIIYSATESLGKYLGDFKKIIILSESGNKITIPITADTERQKKSLLIGYELITKSFMFISKKDFEALSNFLVNEQGKLRLALYTTDGVLQFTQNSRLRGFANEINQYYNENLASLAGVPVKDSFILN